MILQQQHSFRGFLVNLFVCLSCTQDVDSAYLVKADLEDKVGSLTDEINFLRNVYEEVFTLIGVHLFPCTTVNVGLTFSSLFCYDSVENQLQTSAASRMILRQPTEIFYFLVVLCCYLLSRFFKVFSVTKKTKYKNSPLLSPAELLKILQKHAWTCRNNIYFGQKH